MTINFLKQLNTIMPDRVKKIFSSFIHKRLISNKIFLKQYEQIEQLDEMSDARIKEIHQDLLKRSLEHAYLTVPYYRDLFDKYGFDPTRDANDEGLQKLPILEKKDIREKWSFLQSEAVEDYYLATTGGSSGEAIEVALSSESIYREQAFVMHYWSKFGYDFKKSKLATFRGIGGSKITKLNPLYNEILLTPFHLSDRTISDYVKAIDKFGAEFVRGYPSAIANFCILATDARMQLKKQLKCIFLISENLFPWQEKIITDYFKCPIAHFYGHTERAVFAERDKKLINGYWFNPLYGHVEIINDEIICTGFINSRMPLIRYRLDDSVKLLENGRYEILGHRDSSYVLGRNGEQVTQTTFEGAHVTFLKYIRAYQIVQHERGKAELCYLAESNKNYDGLIVNELNREISCISWSARNVDKFQLTQRGKFRPLISEINDD